MLGELITSRSLTKVMPWQQVHRMTLSGDDRRDMIFQQIHAVKLAPCIISFTMFVHSRLIDSLHLFFGQLENYLSEYPYICHRK